MCMCDNGFCPKCDPGIEAFYQTKVEEAKRAVEAAKTQEFIIADYRDLLDAKDIWYEYCQLRDEERVDNFYDTITDKNKLNKFVDEIEYDLDYSHLEE